MDRVSIRTIIQVEPMIPLTFIVLGLCDLVRACKEISRGFITMLNLANSHSLSHLGGANSCTGSISILDITSSNMYNLEFGHLWLGFYLVSQW